MRRDVAQPHGEMMSLKQNTGPVDGKSVATPLRPAPRQVATTTRRTAGTTLDGAKPHRGSRITPKVTAGHTYFIVVDGAGTSQGTFSLTVMPPPHAATDAPRSRATARRADSYSPR